VRFVVPWRDARPNAIALGITLTTSAFAMQNVRHGRVTQKGMTMDITLNPDQEAFVQQAIKAGRIDRVEDAVTEALLLWEGRELLRAELIASLDEARASIARGEGRIITQESMHALATEAKQRLRS